MAKKLDPTLVEILTKYGEDVKEALWDCHGVWVAYHKAIERIAAKAGVAFEMPQIIEANTAAKTATIAVRGTMGERSEWSFGEASPANNKNAYPFAMAEKRAKDRVVLKLIGLHGLVYSEEESDDFKPGDPAWTEAQRQEPPRKPNGRPEKGWREDGTRTAYALKTEQPGMWVEFDRELLECQTVKQLTKLALDWSLKAENDKWPFEWRNLAKEEINKRKEVLLNSAPDDDVFPGDLPANNNSYINNVMAGE